MNLFENLQMMKESNDKSERDIERKLISLVQDNLPGPLADRAGSSYFYTKGEQHFMAIPISPYSDSFDFYSYAKNLKKVFPKLPIYSMMDDYEMVIDVTRFYRELKESNSRIYTATSSAELVLKHIDENIKSSDKNITVESSQYDDFSDDELASIYGGDTPQAQKDLVRSELLSSMNALKIKVKSGISSDGFDVTVVDDRNHTIYEHSYNYGWDVSWNKSFASKDKPYVSDVIKSLCDKYTIPKENIFVYAGTNMFAGKSVRSDNVERFKTKYVDPVNL